MAKRRIDLPDRKNGRDHPVIAGYDPEEGLPNVKYPGKGKPMCPTCLGKGRVNTTIFVTGKDGEEHAVKSSVPCTDCPK